MAVYTMAIGWGYAGIEPTPFKEFYGNGLPPLKEGDKQFGGGDALMYMPSLEGRI